MVLLEEFIKSIKTNISAKHSTIKLHKRTKINIQ